MTRLDFIETIKEFIPNLSIDELTNVVDFYGFRVIFKGFTVKITGTIPYDFAMNIYENQPCKELGISVGLFGDSTCPTEFFTDKIYEREVSRTIQNESFDARFKRLDRERLKFKRRSNEKKFLELYRVDTKEGLTILLKEFKNYFSKKNNEQDINDINSMLVNINTRIIDRISPHVSAYTWMMNSINITEYFAGWNRMKSISYLHEFRRALEEFDRTVNPFIENDLSTVEIIDDLKEMRISAYPFNYDDEYKNEPNLYRVTIENRETKCEVSFGLQPAGFIYRYCATLGDQVFFSLNHFFSHDKKEENRGEIVTISYFGNKCPFKREIRFNLTKGTLGDTHERKTKATEIQIASIYSELVKATKMAADITINNFTKNKTIHSL